VENKGKTADFVFPGFPKDSQDSHGIPGVLEILKRFPGFSEDSLENPESSLGIP
jgi:hypothetical protein